MPRGRMLNREISVSKKLPKVSVYARLLFTWSIPHLDVQGKIFGNPEQIKGSIVPYCDDFTIKKIKTCLKELQENELIIIYGEESCQYLYFPGFQSNQNINETRESPSLIPDPTPEQLQSNSNKAPGEVKLSKVKLSKDKTTGAEPLYEQIINDWNSIAERNGLSKIIKLSDKRKASVKNRLQEKEFNLQKIYEMISESEFLKGNNKNNWKIDFDFVFSSANNYLKILEGKYNTNFNNNGNLPTIISYDELLQLIEGKSSEEKNRIQDLYESTGKGLYKLKGSTKRS